jgi:putative phosphoesterase
VKVAVLSDIHGNLPALQSVLDDFPPLDACVCCGDLVGYYPDVEEVCNILRDLTTFIVRGNHDAYVTGALFPSIDKADAYKVEWTRANLSEKNLSWLATLPVEKSFSWDESRILMRHASPWDEETYLYPDSPRLFEIQLKENEFLFFGHTHRPMWIRAGNGMILNPGSVGQPRDGNPFASYAVFDTMTRNVEMRRVKYNVTVFQNRLKSLGWDNKVIEILSRKKDNI